MSLRSSGRARVNGEPFLATASSGWLLKQIELLTREQGELLRALTSMRQSRDLWRWRCKMASFVALPFVALMAFFWGRL